MKHIYIVGISSLLVLAACSEQPTEQDVHVSGESQEEDSNNNQEGITIGYEYNWEDKQRDLSSLDSQLNEEDYENIKTFFSTFSLPEEGRLSPEEAENYFSEDAELDSSVSFSEDKIYYKNYLIFDADTNMTVSTNIWGYDPNTYDPIEPFETQAIGFFMSKIEEIYNRGYLSPTGESVQEYTQLSEEEQEYLEDESFHDIDQGDNTRPPKGWGAFQSVINSIQSELEYIEPYLKEYQELHTWSAETRQYLQVADAIGYDDYEEAYQYIVAATINMERMYQILPEK
ncbi:hypothetical protein [Gracilibacillus phocaeensis]|uniref:hypothetical protein n=1 Tax=Gracilibacillus phocaeensis TaxID=2042304 RepID=UPI00102F680A|nr:hypothetical protein [Gracilibacillus phocaeensis]